jgi:hypothetical protein
MSRDASDPGPPWDYVLIVGSGGSGSKRLLRIFDHSPETHCRNEPYNNQGSPFALLRSSPRAWALAPGDPAVLEREWDPAVAWTAARTGDRDARPTPPKHHFRPLGARLGLLRLLSSRRLRRIAAAISSDGQSDEWRTPRLFVRGEGLESSLLVMKFNQAPSLARWVLERRPRVKVIHLVRHPAAYLASWRARVLPRCDPGVMITANRDRLRAIADRDESWAARFGPVDGLSAEALELLFWLYDTVSIREAGVARPQYERVFDEDVAITPVAVAKRLYAACGLPWREPVERWLNDRAENWRSGTVSWQEMLSPAEVRVVESLLERSELQGWWRSDQSVSRTDYLWS